MTPSEPLRLGRLKTSPSQSISALLGRCTGHKGAFTLDPKRLSPHRDSAILFNSSLAPSSENVKNILVFIVSLQDHNELGRAPSRGHYDRQANASTRANEQRALILSAARAQFISHYPAVPSVAVVIAATGLGRNTFYGHFRNTGELRRAVIADAKAQLENAAATALEPLMTPLAALSAQVSAWFEAGPVQSEAARALRLLEPLELRRRLQADLSEVHALGARAGAFRQDVSPELFAATAEAFLSVWEQAPSPPAPAPSNLVALATDVVHRLFR